MSERLHCERAGSPLVRHLFRSTADPCHDAAIAAEPRAKGQPTATKGHGRAHVIHLVRGLTRHGVHPGHIRHSRHDAEVVLVWHPALDDEWVGGCGFGFFRPRFSSMALLLSLPLLLRALRRLSLLHFFTLG